MGSKSSGKNKNKQSKEPQNHQEHGTTATGSGSSGGKRGGKKNVISDPRFASVHSDPRFQKVPKHKSKVEIDSRFSRIFTDKSFSGSSALTDPRGKIKKKKAERFLKHYYRIEENEEERNVSSERKEGKNVSIGKQKVRKVSSESESEEERDVSSENEEVGSDSENEVELKIFDDGEDESESSDNKSETDEEDETESSTDEEDVLFEEEDDDDVEVENIPTIEDGTRRLAVVNLDWRHVRAVDLYVVLSSFLPKGGDIVSVAVYPSEFGLERMKEEELRGPVGLFDDDNRKKKKKKDDDDEDEDEDDEIDEEKLRDYERSRLRYYYAVVECDSVATAEHLYKNCDGVEFERSSNVFDLRFIPDSMEFKHPPRDVAKEAPASYEGLDFHTRALQHSNVPISWDEDEPQRVKNLKRKFTADQLAEMELQEFLASDESESDDDDDDGDGDDNSEDEGDKKSKKRDKYRALIQSGDDSDDENDEEGQDMEITFHSGLEGLSKRILEKRDKKSETVWEAHLRKQQEKKKARKKKSKYLSDDESSDSDQEITEDADDFFVDEEEPAAKKAKGNKAKKKNKDRELPDSDKEGEATQAELELLLADDNQVDNGVKGYNLKRLKSKVKKGKEVAEENKIPTAVYNDPRFSALFTSPLYALDPTDPQFKRSAAYATQMAQRQHKGVKQETGDGDDKLPQNSQLPTDGSDSKENENKNADVASLKEKQEISALVRSIKMKSKQVQLPTIGKHKKEKSQSRGAKEMEMPEVQSVKKKTKIMKS